MPVLVVLYAAVEDQSADELTAIPQIATGISIKATGNVTDIGWPEMLTGMLPYETVESVYSEPAYQHTCSPPAKLTQLPLALEPYKE